MTDSTPRPEQLDAPVAGEQLDELDAQAGPDELVELDLNGCNDWTFEP